MSKVTGTKKEIVDREGQRYTETKVVHTEGGGKYIATQDHDASWTGVLHSSLFGGSSVQIKDGSGKVVGQVNDISEVEDWVKNR